MNEIINLSEFESLTKKEITSRGANAAQIEIEEGNVNPLQRYTQLKKLMEYLTSFSEVIKPKALAESQKYGKGEVVFGVKIDIRNTGDRLDYEQDEIYADLQRQLSDRKALIDLATKSKDTIFDGNGVEVPRVPVKTHGSTTLAITY